MHREDGMLKRVIVGAVLAAIAAAMVSAAPAGAYVCPVVTDEEFMCAGKGGSAIPEIGFYGGGGALIKGDTSGNLEWSGGGGGLTSGSTVGGEPGGLGEHCTTENGGPAECVGGCSPGAEFLCSTDPAEPAE